MPHTRTDMCMHPLFVNLTELVMRFMST
jgi:hypothetical protein